MTKRAARGGLWTAVLLLATAAGAAEAERGAALKQRAEQLAKEARALARTEGCEDVRECAVAGFGHKACGGPREFIAYCTRTTDTKALQAKLQALEEAERAWQVEAGIKSTCGLTRKPRPRWENGVCRAW